MQLPRKNWRLAAHIRIWYNQLVKKVPLDFFAKLLPELQNQFLYHDFAILPLRRVMERERTP